MSVMDIFVSISELRRKNRGAYGSPFSGVGMEFYPLGVPVDHSGLVLHETGYLPRNDWWMFRNVFSPFWRLMYNFKRGHRVLFEGREYPVEPGHIMLIPDHRLFHCQGRLPVPTLWMAFNCARVLNPAHAAPILLPPHPAEKELLRLLVQDFTRATAPGHREPIFHHSLALLHIVLNRPELHWATRLEPAGFLRAVRHVEDHHAEPLRVSNLARQAGMTSRGLAKAFQRHRGLSPARYLAQIRIREAAHLLANTAATLEEIAERTGFPNRYHFSRVFKKITGEPPAHFRKAHTGRVTSG